MAIKTLTMLKDATIIGAGEAFPLYKGHNALQFLGSVSEGTGQVCVDIEASNDRTNWFIEYSTYVKLETTVKSERVETFTP